MVTGPVAELATRLAGGGPIALVSTHEYQDVTVYRFTTPRPGERVRVVHTRLAGRETLTATLEEAR